MAVEHEKKLEGLFVNTLGNSKLFLPLYSKGMRKGLECISVSQGSHQLPYYLCLKKLRKHLWSIFNVYKINSKLHIFLKQWAAFTFKSP